MPEGVDAHSDGEQSPVREPRLQRFVDERDGFCDDDLPVRVHVPRHSTVANMHEVKYLTSLLL